MNANVTTLQLQELNPVGETRHAVVVTETSVYLLKCRQGDSFVEMRRLNPADQTPEEAIVGLTESDVGPWQTRRIVTGLGDLRDGTIKVDAPFTFVGERGTDAAGRTTPVKVIYAVSHR